MREEGWLLLGAVKHNLAHRSLLSRGLGGSRGAQQLAVYEGQQGGAGKTAILGGDDDDG